MRMMGWRTIRVCDCSWASRTGIIRTGLGGGGGGGGKGGGV